MKGGKKRSKAQERGKKKFKFRIGKIWKEKKIQKPNDRGVCLATLCVFPLPPQKSTYHRATKNEPGNHTDCRLLPKPGLKTLALHLPDKKKGSSFYLSSLPTCCFSSNILLFFLFFLLRISHKYLGALRSSRCMFELVFGSFTGLSLISLRTTNGLLLLREGRFRNVSARLFYLYVPSNAEHEPTRNG